jgi:hypothetical protein
VGRISGLISVAIGLTLVVLLLGGATPRLFVRFWHLVMFGLVGLFGAVWWLGGLAGQSLAGKRGWHVLWQGPAAALASLLVGAISLASASFMFYGLSDLTWGIGQSLWDYAGKPVVAIMLYGLMPTTLLGLISGAVTWALTGRPGKSVPREAADPS